MSTQQQKSSDKQMMDPQTITDDKRTESHHMIIWKDREGPTNQNGNEDEDSHLAMEDLDDNEELVFTKFMTAHNCYDLIPTSSKLLVFDTQLGVKKAFFALIYNGLRSAPLWDAAQRNFVGMLTITDFIKILQKYYKSPSSQGFVSQLEEHKIVTWRDELHEYTRPIVSISPEASLFDAVQTLCLYKVHRLPVVDATAGNVLFILTHKRILRFLYIYIYNLPQPNFMSKSLDELKLGTYRDVVKVTRATTLITAINLFVEKRISALPVVDEGGQIIDLYAKFDVFNLAVDKSYDNLDVSIGEAIANRKEKLEGVLTCRKEETLAVVMERIVKGEVHRLVVVDKNNRVEGIVSLSDILHFIAIRPASLDASGGKIPCGKTANGK